MLNICVFAGTSEGRKLVEFLSGQPVKVTACAATEYGGEVLTPADNLTISARKLPPDEIKALFDAGGFDLVIDATHPYAKSITESIFSVCGECGIRYIRLLRGEGEFGSAAYYAENAEDAASFLDRTDGNILLTTGSKEISCYAGVKGFAERVYARVLPLENSLKLCSEAGMKPSHIFAMQGPFSEEMNVSLLKMISAAYLVTKNDGDPGGFAEKVSAAERSGARLVVIGRPPQKEGLSLPEVIDLLCSEYGLAGKARVTVAGIGPGAQDYMTKAAADAISHADCLIGAARMLEAVRKPRQGVFKAISPSDIREIIESHPEYSDFTVVMSGDTGFFSGTKKLLPLLKEHEVTVIPGISSLVYLCSKTGRSYEDTLTVSLHGREHDIVRDIKKHRSVFVLVGGASGVKDLCSRLYEAGLNDVCVTVGENLSYPDEKITEGAPGELKERDFDPLSAVLIENSGCSYCVSCGLPDEAFTRSEADYGMVPMTKSEVRAVILSKLMLRNDSVCWDIGAGTGSVSIEMALLASEGFVYAVEKKEAAYELLCRNIKNFGCMNIEAVEGSAPEACRDLPAPTHVFIGGSTGNMKSILTDVLEKNPEARICATAISLESSAELTECIREFGFDDYEAVLLTAARSRKAGSYNLMTGQNPIWIYTMQKTGE